MTTIKAKLTALLPKAFYPVWRASKNKDILNIICKGGRGSGKSSDIAHIIIQLLIRHPVNAVCIRKVDNTLELSIFEQMKGLSNNKVSHICSRSTSPLWELLISLEAITWSLEVLKSLSALKVLNLLTSFYHPLDRRACWINDEAEVTTITNSFLRGQLPDDLQYKFFFSYNPPKRRQSWVNKKYESSHQPSNTFVHHSTYLDNPYISQQFIEEAEATKERNPLRYEWEYLGKAIGSGVVPFDNLKIEPGCITDDMVKNFDNIRQAVDFGYATDPLAYVRWHYDKKKNGIYAIDEFCGQKISNRELANWLKERDYESLELFCDSAEPKSIACRA